jgi:hypothetical protein
VFRTSSDDAAWRIRLDAQQEFLEPSAQGQRLQTIANDLDNQAALSYFAIDEQILSS